MAYFRKLKNGWQVQLQVGKNRLSSVHINKARAEIWAAEKAAELRKIRDLGIDDREPLANALERYAQEQSPKKKGERWERIRLKAIAAHPVFKNKKIAAIDVPLIAKYRDERLQEVSGSTVNRELNLLSSVFQVAMLEWRLIASNPVKLIKKPKESPHREKIISQEEIQDFLAAIPYDPSTKAQTKSECVGLALLFALETGMRAGEICGLRQADVSGSVATLHITKNGRRREVPLSKEAKRILSLLPDQEPMFGLTAARLDPLFRRYRDKSNQDFRFHDARHTAVTRLARRLDMLSLAKVIGHSDPRQLMTYYNPTAADLAHLLD
jgi:integrase